MSDFKIITNNQERPFLYGYEVPEKILNSDFDYLSDDDKTDKFLKYKGQYYHISDFQCTREELRDMGWQGISFSSAFSAVVISVADDMETYKIGLMLA